MQIERYLDHFSRDQLLVILAEALRKVRHETIGRVLEFLDVDASWVPSSISQEFHRTGERWEPRPAFQRIRSARPYRMLADRVPLGWRRSAWSRARRIVGWQVDAANGQITEQLRSSLVDMVRPDVLQLRALLGEGFDGWGIA